MVRPEPPVLLRDDAGEVIRARAAALATALPAAYTPALIRRMPELLTFDERRVLQVGACQILLAIVVGCRCRWTQ